MRFIVPLLAVALAAAAAPTPSSAAELVAVPGFRSVQLHGGGTITVRQGPVQRVTVMRGSTAFTTFRVWRNGELRIDACNSRCPRNYPLEIEIVSPRAPDLAINGGGTIIAARGFAPQAQLSAAINGGGTIDATAVPARNVSAAINGGGEIRVNAVHSLSTAVRGGGEVAYAGNPQVSTAIVGGGTVHRLR